MFQEVWLILIEILTKTVRGEDIEIASSIVYHDQAICTTRVATLSNSLGDNLQQLLRANYLNRLMLLNIKFKGADQILTKVNNLTRAAGLQGRSPLFDQQVVEFSLQIPPEYKLDRKSGIEKCSSRFIAASHLKAA